MSSLKIKELNEQIMLDLNDDKPRYNIKIISKCIKNLSLLDLTRIENLEIILEVLKNVKNIYSLTSNRDFDFELSEFSRYLISRFGIEFRAGFFYQKGKIVLPEKLEIIKKISKILYEFNKLYYPLGNYFEFYCKIDISQYTEKFVLM